MNVVSSSIFSVIEHNLHQNSLRMVWLSANRHMSKIEFSEQIDTFFTAIDTFRVKVVMIDASDFCFPISDSDIDYLNETLRQKELSELVIVRSTHIIGQHSIAKLIKCLAHSNIQLTVLESRSTFSGELL